MLCWVHLLVCFSQTLRRPVDGIFSQSLAALLNRGYGSPQGDVCRTGAHNLDVDPKHRSRQSEHRALRIAVHMVRAYHLQSERVGACHLDIFPVLNSAWTSDSVSSFALYTSLSRCSSEMLSPSKDKKQISPTCSPVKACTFLPRVMKCFSFFTD